MKNVYISWNLELLANKIIEKIIESWKSPFCSPVVIFSDPKIEQWFKLHWLKKQKSTNSVLMNLKTVRLEQFLFDILKPGFSIEKLSSELLRDIIISKLTSKDDNGKYYFEILSEYCKAPEIIKYLTDTTAPNTNIKVNTIHLYDFSQEITSLFMDYEDTCPDELNLILEKNPWQNKLYHDIFSTEGINIRGTRYLTLYQLAKLNKSTQPQASGHCTDCKNKDEETIQFDWDSKRPVFLFGFSGIGELYRNILSEFSKINNLEIFIQTGNFSAESHQNSDKNCQTPAESSGFSANQLINKWAGYGKENLELWIKRGVGTLEILDEETKTSSADNILHYVQNSIIGSKENGKGSKIVPRAFSKDDQSLTLTAAPSKLREIEAVHSKICKLLLQGDTQVGDIIVVAPFIQDYIVAIEQVFDQNTFTDEEQNFPCIPYIIADYSGEKSLTAEALHVFFGILKKGYLCRSDVFALLRNYLVQTVRGISENELSAWSAWTTQMHVYRDRGESEDVVLDWQKAKIRLLLSRLTEYPMKKNDEEDYLPYETIESSDDTSLYKFIQAIDELEEWTKFSEKDRFNSDDIKKLRNILKKWICLENTIPANLFNETLVFQNIIEEIDRQEMMIASTDEMAEAQSMVKNKQMADNPKDSDYIYKDCFFFALFDRSRSVTLHNSKILSQGITFANFESNRVLSAKYVFFVGLDSKAFPGIDSISDLDLRTKGFETVPRKKNAFLCQLMSAKEGFFISFINKDLQKDEDFFKSSVLADLFDTIYFEGKIDGQEQIVYEQTIKIDENRPWSELFTSREFRNKSNFIKLQGKQIPESDLTQTESTTATGSFDAESESCPQSVSCTADKPKDVKVLPDRVPIYKIKKFLSDPFQFMAEAKFNPNEDDSDEELFEFEPLVFDNLTKSSLSKDYVKEFLVNNGNVTTDDLKHKLKNQNVLPDSFFGELALKDIAEDGNQKAKLIGDYIKNVDSIIFSDKKALPLLIKQQINGDEKEWSLTGSLVWHIFEENSNEITTIEINKNGNCLNGYVTSLALLASLKNASNTDTKYSVKMHVVSMKSSSNPIETQNAEISPKEAYSLLQSIYYAMFVESYHICAPFSLVKDNIKADSGNEFSEFKRKLSDSYGNGEWQFFAKKDLFDMDKDIGYRADNFTEEWAKAREHQKKLIVFLN